MFIPKWVLIDLLEFKRDAEGRIKQLEDILLKDAEEKIKRLKESTDKITTIKTF